MIEEQQGPTLGVRFREVSVVNKKRDKEFLKAPFTSTTPNLSKVI